MSVSQSHDDLGASPANLLSGKNKSISTPTSDYEGNIFELGSVWNAGKASGKERRKRRYLMQLISKSPRKFLTSSVKSSCPHSFPKAKVSSYKIEEKIHNHLAQFFIPSRVVCRNKGIAPHVKAMKTNPCLCSILFENTCAFGIQKV